MLQKHGFTATCYGVSGLLGGTNVWDADKVAAKLLMTAPEWRRWHEAGMDVGSHTCTHADLTAADATTAREEIARSKTELEQTVGCEVRHFCYPYGRYRPEHVRMAEEAGYATATTTHRGRMHVGDGVIDLTRIMVARATTVPQFALKVMTAYEDKRA